MVGIFFLPLHLRGEWYFFSFYFFFLTNVSSLNLPLLSLSFSWSHLNQCGFCCVSCRLPWMSNPRLTGNQMRSVPSALLGIGQFHLMRFYMVFLFWRCSLLHCKLKFPGGDMLQVCFFPPNPFFTTVLNTLRFPMQLHCCKWWWLLLKRVTLPLGSRLQFSSVRKFCFFWEIGCRKCMKQRAGKINFLQHTFPHTSHFDNFAG